MRFSYTFTVWEYREALRLHRAQKFSRQLHFALLYRVVPVLAVGGLVLLGVYDLKVRTLGAWIGLSFLIALCWIGIMLAFVPRNQLRCGFKRSTPAGQSTISVDDEGVFDRGPRHQRDKNVLERICLDCTER